MRSSHARGIRFVSIFGWVAALALVLAWSAHPAPSLARDRAPVPSAAKPAAAPAAALVSNFMLGAQVLTPVSSPNYDKLLDQARAMGVQHIRTVARWGEIQPNAPAQPGCGNCDWQAQDQIVSKITARGMMPLVVVGGSPKWAASTPDGVIDQSNGVAAFANFVAAMAARYPNVTLYEFFNEPDDWPENTGNDPTRGWGGHGDQYAAMLKAVYPALKAANPRAQVIFGGIAYETWEGCTPPKFPNSQCFDMNFVGEALAAGAANAFDLMNFHFYDNPVFWSKLNPQNAVGKALKLRQNFPALANKPFVITEIGKPNTKSDEPNAYSHEEASRTLVHMYVQILSAAAPEYNLQIMSGTWYLVDYLQECLGANCVPNQIWGLTDKAGQALPLESAVYRTLASELAGAQFLSRITGAPNIEGALLNGPRGLRAAAWSTAPNSQPAFYAVQSALVRVRTKSGEFTDVRDGGAGDLDNRAGWIGVSVTASPIWIEWPARVIAPTLCNAASAQRLGSFARLAVQLFAGACP